MDAIPILPCKVRALYSWSAQESHDLGFVEGDIIQVTSTNDGDWWTGKLMRNKVVGTFPRNFVEFVNPHQPTMQPVDKLRVADIPSATDSMNKSTQDILNDISIEINDLSFYDLNKKPSDLGNQVLVEEDDQDEASESDEDVPPPPPPHLIVPGTGEHFFNDAIDATQVDDIPINLEAERSLMEPQGNSPLIEETPFDPKALAREYSQKSHDDSLVPEFAASHPVTKTKGLVRRLFRSILDDGSDIRRTTSQRSQSGKSSVFEPMKFWRPNENSSEPFLNDSLAINDATKVLLDPHWMDSTRDLYRAKTISPTEMAKRRRRLELQGKSLVDPFKLLEQRCEGDTYEYYLENFDHVDSVVMSMSTWPQLMTPAVLASSQIGRKFSDPVDRLRGIFMLCSIHITYEPNSQGPDSADSITALTRAMQTKRATAYEMAHVVASMCSALNIECKVIRGHYRPTNAVSTGMVHAWNAVNIEGDWRLMDASAASPTFPGAFEDEINTFYFLTPPAQSIFTHIPMDPLDQFLAPPMPTSVVINLPIAAPGAFRDQIKFVDYFSGLTALEDLEPCEFSVLVPNHDLDLVAEVEVPLNDSVSSAHENTTALAQPYWEQNQRRFRVKALLPENVSKATLYLYTVDRRLHRQSRDDRVLAYSLCLSHSGNNAKFRFLSRFTSPKATRNDLYISEPQCRNLKGGHTYKFRINQHPSRGITAGSGVYFVRVAIQSPSGRITKLERSETNSPGVSSWNASIRTLEVGNWRALVSNDNGEGWTPFAEWFCA